MNWLRRRRPATLYAALVVGFVLFRLVLFGITTAGEYRLYKRYGDAARATTLADLYRTQDIEYPHLGVAFGELPTFFANDLPQWSLVLVRWRPNKFEIPYQEETPAEREAGDRYEVAFGLVIFALDAWCLCLVYAIARRVYPNEDAITRVGRLAAYGLATGSLGLILFDRQDLVVGWLALVAVWALASGRPRFGYAVLVVGAAYKLVPMLLLPVWVLAAAAVKAGPNAKPGRFLRHVAIEAAIGAALLALWPLLTYYLGGGERAFLFLTWHSARGLQAETAFAWPIILLDPPGEIVHGYGSYNLRGALADRVAKVLGIVIPLASLAAAAISARGFWRAATLPSPLEGEGGDASPPGEGNPMIFPSPGSLASLANHPLPQGDSVEYPALIPHVVASSLLIWLAFITANKVGSPQYLIWVAPLVPLLPLRMWSERGWALLLLLAMIATTTIFPCRYKWDLIGEIVSDEPLTWRGPNTLGLFLLATKSLTLIAATAWMAVAVWRSPPILDSAHPPPFPSPEPKP